jgi:hypothetical protein
VILDLVRELSGIYGSASQWMRSVYTAYPSLYTFVYYIRDMCTFLHVYTCIRGRTYLSMHVRDICCKCSFLRCSVCHDPAHAPTSDHIAAIASLKRAAMIFGNYLLGDVLSTAQDPIRLTQRRHSTRTTVPSYTWLEISICSLATMLEIMYVLLQRS